MAIQRQRRRGTRAENDLFTGAVGEFSYLTDEKRVVTHDGSTQGGTDLPIFSDEFNNTYSYAAASGTDVLTITLKEAPASYSTGMGVKFKAANNNTGGVTINVNGLGAKAINKSDGTTLVALDADDIIQNGMYKVSYNGTVFVLQNSTKSGKGDWDTISTLSLSSSPDITFTSGIDSTYKLYRIRCINVDLSIDRSILALTDSNGGASFDTGSSDYNWAVTHYQLAFGTTGNSLDSGASSMVLTGIVASEIGGGSSEGFHLDFLLWDPSAASIHTRCTWDLFYGDISTRAVRIIGSGTRKSGTAVNAIRIMPVSGNFTSGEVSLQGWNVL